jgi:YfiH family protein
MERFYQEINKGFLLKEKDGVQYLAIPSFLDAGISTHCFTTRIGGVSEGCYASLNLSKTRENNPRNKEENYRKVCDVLGVPYESLTLVNYAHGTGTYVVEEKDVGKGITKETDIPKCDALLTNTEEITAVTLHADCVPLFFADVKHKAVCVSHAGWRGVYHGIVPHILQEFTKRFFTHPSDIIVGIGPHIMSCCFEVQDDVAQPFVEKFGEAILTMREGRSYINLQQALLMQLKDGGILPYNITCADLCTSCRDDLFYSHRRDHGNTGAMGSFISVRGWR